MCLHCNLLFYQMCFDKTNIQNNAYLDSQLCHSVLSEVLSKFLKNLFAELTQRQILPVDIFFNKKFESKFCTNYLFCNLEQLKTHFLT
jgi:hypothetical protein